MRKVAEAGAPLYVAAMAAWVAGEIRPRPQDHSQATWVDRLEKKAGFIDWALPADELSLRCRAFSPWPGTFTFFEGKRLLVHRAKALSGSTTSSAKPGTVVRFGSEIAVVAGESLLRLDRVQLEGRESLDIHDFVRGQRGFVGARLL
jgi:methionyl-tRNA formyltransferase